MYISLCLPVGRYISFLTDDLVVQECESLTYVNISYIYLSARSLTLLYIIGYLYTSICATCVLHVRYNVIHL